MSTNRSSPNAGYCNQKKLPKGPNGRNLCRWCQTEVPKNRRTYCSDGCVHEWRVRSDPAYARALVFQRDHGICAMCGIDCETTLHTLKHMANKLHKPLLIRQERLQADRDLIAMIKELKSHGFRISLLSRFNPYESLWDCDHTLPVVEGGGECGLEGMRTLCHPCHKQVTTALRKRLAERRKKAKQLTLVKL